MAATAGVIAELGPDEGPVGVGLPSPIVDGVAMAAANIDKSWIGVNAVEAFSEAVGPPVHGAQRRRRGGPGGDALRRRQGRQGRGADADAGHRHRLGAVRQRRAGAEPRARPHRDPGQGRRAARLGRRARPQGPLLQAVGAVAERVPRPHRRAHLAGPGDPGWRGLQARREVRAAARRAPAGGAGDAPQRGGHRGHGDAGAGAARPRPRGPRCRGARRRRKAATA